MLIFAIIMTLVSMAIVMVRMVNAPTTYDRILTANNIGTKTVVLIVLMAVVMGDLSYLDIAIIYALMNFIATIALLKYFKYKSLGGE